MFMAFLNQNSGDASKRGWLLDSGCTHHTCGDIDSFKDKSKVKIGNGNYVAVEGRGDVLINTPGGKKQIK